ncbi:MAG: nucleotidyltransferase domain-containing protein [Candidatus Thermoplasmatota archaeon]|nr:nucleotidyltransferase domain-containing protein [Candidatus Thermoplasmatota archaeon]
MFESVKKDFEFIKDQVEGVLLFGSHVIGEAGKRSDIDVCLVSPKDKNIIFKIFEKLGGKYDVKVFEELPLYIKIDIIKNHYTIFGDEVELSYYFYKFRKEWQDVEPRIKRNRFNNAREMIRRRRIWLNERKVHKKA